MSHSVSQFTRLLVMSAAVATAVAALVWPGANDNNSNTCFGAATPDCGETH